MTSNDIRIVINGWQFVIDGQILTPRLDSIESRVGKLEQAEQRGALNYMQSSLNIWECFSRKTKPATEVNIEELAAKL